MSKRLEGKSALVTGAAFARAYASKGAAAAIGDVDTERAATVGARRMIVQGRGGKIINMASQAVRRGESLVAVYCAAKASVVSLTQSAGLNLITHKINVNTIAPGVEDGEH